MTIARYLLIITLLGGCHPQKEAVWHEHVDDYVTAPAVVVLDESLQDPYNSSLKAAVKWVNRAVGCRVLYLRRQVEEDTQLKLIYINHESVDVDNPRRVADSYSGKTYSLINIYRPLDIRLQMFVFIHELGHVLGLAHDRFGMMNGKLHALQNDLTIFREGIHGQWIAPRLALENVYFSSKDRKALHRRYCN